MTRTGCGVVMVAVACLCPLLAQARLSADQVMERNFEAAKVPSLVTRSSMTLIARDGSRRERTLYSVAALDRDGIDSKIVIQFESPPDLRRTAFLEIQHQRRDDDLWVYLPALGRVRRLVASDRGSSFFGSDFSYGDILGSRPDRYRNHWVKTAACGRHPCDVIDSVPRDAKVAADDGYSRKVTWVRTDDFVEARVDYYGPRGNKLKTETVSAVRPAGSPGHWIATHRVMTNDETGHRSDIVIQQLSTHTAVPGWEFTPRALRRQLYP